MNQPQATLIDTTQKDNYQKIGCQQQTLSSHDADWRNLIFEHYCQPAGEMPEVAFKHHTIVVSLRQIVMESKMDGRWQNQTIPKGETIVIPAQLNYWSVDRTDSEFVVLSLNPQELQRNNQELFKGEEFELIPTFARPDPFIYGTVLALQQQLLSDFHGSYLYAESMLNSLGVHLLHQYANRQPQIKYYGGLAPHKLKQAIEYINDHLDKRIKLDDVAQLLDLSSYYFCREFRNSVGVSPYRYIIDRRIEKAQELIKNTKLSLADVAYESGFSSQSQMTQHFRKSVGVTPKVYRDRL